MDALLSENTRPAKRIVNTGLLKVLGLVSREGRWGWDGACLETVSAIAHDPIAADINVYRYCTNNPVDTADPNGEAPKQWDWTCSVYGSSKKTCRLSYTFTTVGGFSKGALVDTVPTGAWDFRSLTLGTTLLFSTLMGIGGYAWFSRPVTNRYEKVEEIEIYGVYNCETVTSYSGCRCPAGQFTTHTTERTLDGTKTRVVPNAFISIADTEWAEGIAVMNPQNGDVSARDPSGVWHPDVEEIQTIHAGGPKL